MTVESLRVNGLGDGEAIRENRDLFNNLRKPWHSKKEGERDIRDRQAQDKGVQLAVM